MLSSRPLSPAAPALGFASAVGWLEALLLIASAAGGLLATHLVDSVWVREGLVGWALVVPFLVGLKHGLMPGTLAVGVTILALPGVAAGAAHSIGHGWLVAWALASLVVGQVTERRQRLFQTAERRRANGAAALEALFREREVIRLSHSLLEERLAATDWSLLASVTEAEKVIAGKPLAEAAKVVLELLESQTSVRASAFYLSVGDSLAEQPSATMGLVTRTRAGDKLLRAALSRRSIVVTEGGGDSPDAGGVSSAALVAIPVVSSTDTVLGVVAIHELPFVTFHHAQFALVGALVNRFADALAQKLDVRGTAGEVLSPRCAPRPAPARFAVQVHGRPTGGLPPLPAALAPVERSGVYAQPVRKRRPRAPSTEQQSVPS